MTEQEIEDAVNTENENPVNMRLNRIKSVDITIDSLKQYITLSTVSIAGLLTFYNGNGKEGDQWLFVITVAAFIFCAVFSVVTINTFINQLHYNETNVRDKSLRTKNFIAIGFFALGIGLATTFFIQAFSHPKTKVNNNSAIIIEFDETSIEIGKEVRAKTTIEFDSITKVKIVTIENK